MQQLSPKKMRQRKFLLVLPVLIIPFLLMAFWALGGGKGSPTDARDPAAGLNLELPGASIKDDKAMDKLAYYDQATEDSLKLQEQMKNDPYFTKTTDPADPLPDAPAGNIPDEKTPPGTYSDPNEAKVYAKLGQLNAAMKENAGTRSSYTSRYQPQTTYPTRPEETMTVNDAPAPDPEMGQLNGMLEKILDIQHPERVKASAHDSSTAPGRPVTSGLSNITFSSFDTGMDMQAGFYGLHDSRESVAKNAIEAVVHETQTLVTGAVVKMRLLADVVIDGHRIAKDNFVFGTANLNNERLEIAVHSIRDGASLFPVKMEVFDMDGLAGIYIPGAISRDVAKQSGDNALRIISPGMGDPSIGAQAASAGIETAKELLSRKVKLIRVQVKAGYKILLRNSSN